MTWKAVTESGKTYAGDRHSITIHGTNGSIISSIYRVFSMKSAVPDDELGHPWEDEDKWHDVDVPIVGQLLFVAGRESWRTSTPIVSVEYD